MPILSFIREVLALFFINKDKNTRTIKMHFFSVKILKISKNTVLFV